MKFTLSWLKRHLETDRPLDEIATTLSMIGLEVESIEDRAKALAPFTVAFVKEARQHPNAERLRVCIVDTGKEEVQVVCGAPNARTGMKGVFAPVGATIPGTDLLLKAGKIRGEASNGMLVSEREMGLSDEHEGIIELPEDAEVGQPFAATMGLDDPVIDLGITPNRGDCLGVHGIARDLAAAGLGRLKAPEYLGDAAAVPGVFDSPRRWLRDLPEGLGAACPYVAGRSFRKVKNGPSPRWLQDRLQAIGLRPISALVDITNFVTMDLGRPLHVFDAAKLKGDLTMRMAREGEEILALDGKTYALDPEMVIIADEVAPQGIGGVMGGELSGVTEETSEVFLEVALFDPLRVARTGRRLGIHSDARYRFERGVDPLSAEWGCEVAARLVAELCGGEASGVVSAGALPDWRREIALRGTRVQSLAGIEIALPEQRRILEDLGFGVTEEPERLLCQVPAWRPDIEGEACLVEEVARIHGYDHLPSVPTSLDGHLPASAISTLERRQALARTALAWRGLDEAVTWSFVSSRDATLFGGVLDELKLINPISSDLDVMRPAILACLIPAAARNVDRGFPDVGLFEVGPQYRDDTPKGQDEVAAGLRTGLAAPRHWSAQSQAVDAFDAKADALAVLEACEAPVGNLQVTTDAPAWYHPGQSGVLRLGPNVLAHFGVLHPGVCGRLGLKGPAAGFEVFLERLPVPKAKGGKAKPMLKLSAFQPVVRDFAFLMDADVPAEKAQRAARGAEKALIAEVQVFDAYQGKGIDEGKKSLALAVTLQPVEHTLTDAELEAVSGKIVAAVEKATGGTLRG